MKTIVLALIATLCLSLSSVHAKPGNQGGPEASGTKEGPRGKGKQDGRKDRRHDRKGAPLLHYYFKENFDQDGDGTLSQEERQAAKDSLIQRYDADNDGALSPEERKASMEAIRLEVLDTDGDGVISEEERAARPKPQHARRKKNREGASDSAEVSPEV